MKRSFVRAAMVVGLWSGLAGCKTLGAGSGTAAAPGAPPVEFVAVPGAPSFTPVEYGFSIRPGTATPRGPHVKLGELVVRPVPGGPPVSEKKMVAALTDEGRRRGGNEMHVTACDASECRALLFRTGKEAEPYAMAGAPNPANASPTALPAWAAGLVPNNQALIKGLIAIWTPDEKTGETREDARGLFEKELIRSVLYVNEGPGARKEADKIFVYTDEASVVNAEGPSAKAVPVHPGLAIETALRQKRLLYVLYEEGNDGTSLFTALDENFLPDLLARVKAAR
jgi:hypothetical protein